MHAWESIQKSIDFIEAHLTEEIQLETLASVAALSPFYFQRLFHRLVRKPVYEYVKLRRLAEAAFLLQNETPRILDIAMEYGFSSHANFTRSFKETFGITPAEYRKNPVVLNQFVKPELILDYIMIDEGVPIEQLMGGETTGVAVAAALWDTFHQEKHKLTCTDFAIEMYYPKAPEAAYLEYWIVPVMA